MFRRPVAKISQRTVAAMGSRRSTQVTSAARHVPKRTRAVATAIVRKHTLPALRSGASMRNTLLRGPALASPAASVVHRAYASAEFDGVEIEMPALSPTMETGNIVEWVAGEGDQVNPGDVLCRIETDKATMDFESPEEGYLARILVPEGTDNVKLGEIICLIVFDEDEIESAKNYSGGNAPAAKTAPAAEAQPEPEPASSTQQSQPQQSQPQQSQPKTSSDGRVLSSPAAKHQARTNGVDLADVKGTGPNARVVQADVKDHLSKGAGAKTSSTSAAAAAQATVAGATFQDLPVSNIRKVIANKLTASKRDVPHYYLTVDFPVDDMLRVRKEFNALANDSFKLSVNDFVIKAAAMSMHHVPEVNSAWMEGENGLFIRQYENVDVNVAVNTDNGLLTPLITDANYKGLQEINADVKQLADLAKDGKLTAAQMAAGTFTISNLGMFGIRQFTAVINPPQAAILAVGGSEQRVVPAADGAFKTQTYMTVTLSCDHRVVDGAIGAEWLQYFVRNMKDPTAMLL